MGSITLAVQFTRLMLAIQKASALVAPACWTKPSNARRIPEHSYAGHSPAHISAATLKVPTRDTEARHRDHGCDHVASPVHDIEYRAFNGSRLLPLDSLPKLRLGAKVLCVGDDRDEVAEEYECESELQGDMDPVRLGGAMNGGLG